MKDFLNADFKDIIAEIKQSRKGAAMIICFICLCCAAIDFILRKHGINEDWFTHSYILIFFTSLATILIKVYNEICDKKDAERKLKEEESRYYSGIAKLLEMIKPAFDNLENKEKILLYKFVEEKSRVIILKEYIANLDTIINLLNIKLNLVGLKVRTVTNYPTTVIEIDKDYFSLLNQYFSEGLQK